MEKCTFSTVTQKYLDSYAGILDTMTGTMNCAKENDSISYNFIVKMIPHHQAAIRISEELLRYTTCIALQNIATEIVVTQTKETEEMRKCSADVQDTVMTVNRCADTGGSTALLLRICSAV